MQQYIGFKVNSGEYMIPILNVREIISMPSITALPNLPEYIRGVTNLRGAIIPVVNLNTLLNSYNGKVAGNTVIVLSSGRITFGVIVDGITGVIKVNETEIEPPESIINNNADYVQGVAKVNNKLIVLLDTRKLLLIDDMSMLEEAIVDVKELDDGINVEVSREVEGIGGKVTIKELHVAKEYFGDKIRANDSNQEIFQMMLEFMDALSDQKYDTAENIMSKIVKSTDSSIFKEVGKITRKLHDSLEDFKGSINNGLQKIARNDVPNAVDDLQLVVKKTEDAANRTMALVERYFEESGDFNKHIENIRGHDNEVNYLTSFKDALDNNMTEILTAQQFQDITGQTIAKVISLVNSVEAGLLNLITRFGMPIKSSAGAETAAIVSNTTALNVKDDSSELQSDALAGEKITQSDVESLLNDFGF